MGPWGRTLWPGWCVGLEDILLPFYRNYDFGFPLAGPAYSGSVVTREYVVAQDPSVRVIVAHAGLACCSLEVEAAVSTGLLEPALDGEIHEGPRVLVVAGTLTTPLIPALQQVLDSLPAPTAVMAFGACATSGGPYWDSPEVVPGIAGLARVTTYVPGCPPAPQALVDALLAECDPARHHEGRV